MLIERGADPSAQDNNRYTPLHLASLQGHVDIARMLIEHGADPSAQGRDGDTPFHLASLEVYMKVAHMLIKRGADPTSSDSLAAVGVGDFDMEPDLDMGLDCECRNNRGKRENTMVIEAVKMDFYTPTCHFRQIRKCTVFNINIKLSVGNWQC